MKATIVKNDDFETVGFEVTVNGKRVFGWGISPQNPIYWTKPVCVENWYTEIFALVALQAKRNEQCDFVSDFFETAQSNPEIKKILENSGVNMTKHDEKCKRTEEKMLNIIKKIK